MKIAVDVMGFENDLIHAIKACRDIKKNFRHVEIVLVGNNDEISKIIRPNEFEVVHTIEFIKQNDSILNSLRKPNSSMQLAINLLNENKVSGIVSAGSTPIYVVSLYKTIGLINGIKKPGFMPTFPTIYKNITFNMLDVGASIETTPYDLNMFAIMANEYAKTKINNPKIALLNIATEKLKGPENLKVTDKLLTANKNLNYIGFIEPNNLMNYGADVVVCNGFVGNIALKSLEGASKAVANAFKKEYKRPYNFLATLFSLPIIRKVKKTFDYRENAGAVVLGLKKLAIKTHGSADYKQFYSAIRVLIENVNNNVQLKIEKAVEKYLKDNPNEN